MKPSAGAARVSAVLVLLGAAVAGCAVSSPAQPSSTDSPSAVGAVSHRLPGCATGVASGPELSASDTAMTTLFPAPGGGQPTYGPFGVAVTAAGNWGFATSVPITSSAAGSSNTAKAGQTPPPPSPSPSPSASSGGTSGVDVLRLVPGHAPVLVRTITVRGLTAGAVLSPNGRLLLVAGGAGATVISVRAAEQGSKHAVLGSLVRPGGSTADGAIEVAVTPDGRYAFVSLEGDAQIAVFDLAEARAASFRAGVGYVGAINSGYGPVGMTVSPDGRWLYATSLSESGPSQVATVGSLSVISVARAESDPAESVQSTVPAGCTPVRVITSANGSVVWVTAQGSDALLAFAAARLQASPAHALLADVQVGEAPVGVALARAGSLIVVSDSSRYAAIDPPPSNLAVVNVADALAGRPAFVGYLAAGRFPRDVAASANGSLLLVANYASGQVEAVNAAALP